MSNIVPFGKYHNQPIENLIADEKYCDWLMAQPWFKDKFAVIYNVIKGTPDKENEDTPEHNKIQAMFLDYNFISKYYRYWQRNIPLKQLTSHSEFEVRGWDVVIRIKNKLKVPRMHYFDIHGCKCDISSDEYKRYCDIMNGTANGTYVADIYDRAFVKKLRWGITCSDRYDIYEHRIEIKSSMGDDYPSVLRQMKSRRDYSGSKLIVDRLNSSTDTNTLKKYFACSDIDMILLQEITG